MGLTKAQAAGLADTSVSAGGKTLQISSVNKTDTTSTTSTSYVDIAGITLNITPQTNSKLLIQFCKSYSPTFIISMSKTKTDTSSMTGETPTDIPGLTVTITPSNASNKIFIIATVNYGGTFSYPGFNLLRGSTEICVGTYGSGSNRQITSGGSNPDSYKLSSNTFQFLDSPNTTSATTYKVQMSTYSTHTLWINRPLSVSSSYNYTMGVTSTITVQEVAA